MNILNNEDSKFVKLTLKMRAKKRLRKISDFMHKYAWVIILVILLGYFVVVGVCATAEKVAGWHASNVMPEITATVNTVHASNLK